MNRQQYIAIKHHGRLAAETMHDRFRHLLSPSMSLVLTVNSGYE